MSRCRASCVSFARVWAEMTIDPLAPRLAAIVPLAYGAALRLAPSGQGAGARPMHCALADGSQVIWSGSRGQVSGPVADYVVRVSWPGTAARK
jgi:hypothetical protein